MHTYQSQQYELDQQQNEQAKEQDGSHNASSDDPRQAAQRAGDGLPDQHWQGRVILRYKERHSTAVVVHVRALNTVDSWREGGRGVSSYAEHIYTTGLCL